MNTIKEKILALGNSQVRNSRDETDKAYVSGFDEALEQCAEVAQAEMDALIEKLENWIESENDATSSVFFSILDEYRSTK